MLGEGILVSIIHAESGQVYSWCCIDAAAGKSLRGMIIKF